jgi:NADH-quinone oxidoreductase subunit M
MRQRDFNLLLGNSSVAHMGFPFLGIASLTVLGVSGAVVLMVAHGLLAALSFGLSGYLYNNARTLEMSQFSGLLKRLPFVGTALVMAAFAGCGLPGFANFSGEIMVLFGSWKQLQPYVVAAAWGALIISAIYMLRAVRAMVHGPVLEQSAAIPDANTWRKVPFVLLLAALLAFGIWPRLLTDKITPSAEALLSSPETVAEDTADPSHVAQLER